MLTKSAFQMVGLSMVHMYYRCANDVRCELGCRMTAPCYRAEECTLATYQREDCDME
jgi:hypothetical protein